MRNGYRRAAGLALLLAACGGDADAEGAGPERPPALVEVASPRRGALTLERTYLGLVRAGARAQLAPGAAGEIVAIRVREGDRVARGEVLVRVDADVARATLRAARAEAETTDAQRAQATREAARFSRAGERLVGGLEIERATAEADVLDAERQTRAASVAQARASLRRHLIVAPFDGIIAARLADAGDWASPGAPVLELIADQRTEVLVRVEPALLDDVGAGTEATLRREGREATARVEGVVRALDPSTRTAPLRLSVPSADWLLPGATVDVTFTIEHTGEGLVVPRDALVEGVTATRVIRVVDGKARPVDIEVLERGAEEIRVRALRDGDALSVDAVLVVRGNERLRPEQAVQITGESGAAESGAAENGAAENGAAENGAAENGAAENGAAENGAAENGAAENGAAENGAAENGAAENGAAENGADEGRRDARGDVGGDE